MLRSSVPLAPLRPPVMTPELNAHSSTVTGQTGIKPPGGFLAHNALDTIFIEFLLRKKKGTLVYAWINVSLPARSLSSIYLFSISLICAPSSQALASSHLISKRAEMHRRRLYRDTVYYLSLCLVWQPECFSPEFFILFSARVHLDLCCPPACRCQLLLQAIK